MNTTRIVESYKNSIPADVLIDGAIIAHRRKRLAAEAARRLGEERALVIFNRVRHDYFELGPQEWLSRLERKHLGYC